MAQLKSVDTAVVITSELTNEQIAKAKKYFPDALLLKEKDEEGKSHLVFAIDNGDEGTVTARGIVFPSTAATKDEKASVTINIPKLTKAKRAEYVKDNFGKALMRLNQVEANFKEQADSFDKEYANLDKSIVIE